MNHYQQLEAEAIEILDLDIFSPISIERDTTRELRFAIEPARNRFEIASRPRLQDVPWTRHATGRVSAISPPPDRRIEIPARIVEHWDIDALYAHGQDLGLHYGPTFRLAETVVLHADLQASIHLSAPDAAVAARAAAGSAIDPIRFDAVFHALLAVKTAYPDKRVPRRFGRLRAFVRPGSPPAMGLFSVLREGPTASLTHIQVADGSGHILVEMEDAWFMHSLVPASHEPPRFWGVQRVPVAPAKIGSGAAPAVAAPAEQSETALLFEAAVAGGIAAAMETFGHGRPILPETLVAEGRLEPENQAFLEGLLAALTAGTPRLMLSTALETGIGRRLLQHLAALQAVGPTPTAPGLAPGWRPGGDLFAAHPACVWGAVA